jgi:peroxiredoxin (alkyl hydroperoxide reductase subunit C)
VPGIIAPGTPAPEFTLRTEDGDAFTRESLLGRTTVLVFFPFAFSPVCTDQFTVYEHVLDQFGDAQLYGVSTDASPAQTAFREHLGVSIPMLSDFEPKGAAARAFGAYFEPAGMTNRALVVVDPEGVVRWSHLAANPGELPGADLVAHGLAVARGEVPA